MKKNVIIKVMVEVLFTHEDDYVIATCPALNVSSYGKTEKEAKKNFDEAIEIFFEETNRKGTLEKNLVKNGWTLSPKSYDPPRYTAKDILTRFGHIPPSNVMTEKYSMPIPA